MKAQEASVSSSYPLVFMAENHDQSGRALQPAPQCLEGIKHLLKSPLFSLCNGAISVILPPFVANRGLFRVDNRPYHRKVSGARRGVIPFPDIPGAVVALDITAGRGNRVDSVVNLDGILLETRMVVAY